MNAKDENATASQDESAPLEGDFFPEELYSGLRKKDAPRAMQTFLRNSYRTHMTLSAMADRKANIMVRLNSFLITGVVIFFKNILATDDIAVVAAVIFLVTSLTSLIFAALAARPNIVDSSNMKTPSINEAKRNIFFFGNFIKLKVQDYERAFDAVMKDQRLIYGNMARDLYYLGKILARKYRLLSYSYNSFIGGLILTVLSFLLAVLI